MLSWYDGNKRSLPWRETSDPYAIWLSEMMLQQTTVRTVEPRWRRFLERWPTLADLARAPLDDVLHEWTGLGYYARARNLHKAAIVVSRDFGGTLPGQFELLLTLPGMGPYTAAAVASIAFGEPVALVDANVERVLSRLYAYPQDIKTTRAKRDLKQMATELLDPRRPGDFNQAMMELGATICLPGNPACGQCPVASFCAGRAGGDPGSFPVKAQKPPLEEAREAALLFQRNGQVFLVKRPREGSFGGMWELPRLRAKHDEDITATAGRCAGELLGIAVKFSAPTIRLRHVVMRSRITLSVYPVHQWEGEFRLSFHEDAGWFPLDDWEALPKSTTQEKIRRILLGGLKDDGGGGQSPEPDLFDALNSPE